MTGFQLRTVRVGALGWGLVVAGGAAFGLGLARLAGWPALGGVLVGVLLLIGVVWLLDRRAFRKATTIIRLDRSVAELDQLAARLRDRKLKVAVSRDPRGIACSGRIHRKVVDAIETDAAARQRGR